MTQVRGFADQRLHKPQNPLDPSNSRISLIVQYLDKKPELALPKFAEPSETNPADSEAKPEGHEA
jgi:chemotaxis protein MotB